MLQKLTDETIKDPELQQLHKVVMYGWQHSKEETPPETKLHQNYRTKISCDEGLMFKGDRIIVQRSVQKSYLG